jgi:hypothetical protein
MRRILKISVLCLAAGALSACRPDEVIESEVIPTAGVRFIHAVPDLPAVDFRFVDLVESNAHYNVAFRGGPTTSGGITALTKVQFKAARAGARQWRIFRNSTSQTTATIVIDEGTTDLTAGHNYTFLLWGYSNTANGPAMQLTVIDETVDPGSQVALRVINATANAIDVAHYPDGGTAPVTPQWNDVPGMTVSTIVNTAPGRIRFDVSDALGTPIITNALALPGSPAVTTAPGPFDAVPGTTVAGSAVTAIVFPPSIAGSGAASFSSTGHGFVWDKRPPRPPGV